MEQFRTRGAVSTPIINRIQACMQGAGARLCLPKAFLHPSLEWKGILQSSCKHLPHRYVKAAPPFAPSPARRCCAAASAR
eukprot:3787-Chlamydomonas_euryale.AAC.1